VPEARTVLAFTERAAARDVEKLLRSAVANAEANHNLMGDDLIVKAAFVDEGPVLKRWRARARGRAARIRKPTCHITVTLVPADGTAATVTRAPEAPTVEKPKRTSRRKAVPKTEKPKAEKTEKPKAEAKPKASSAKKKAPAKKKASDS
jgi:large subunit ribosomal protein L22